MAALVTAVIVPAAGPVGVVMRLAVVVARVSVRGRGSRLFAVLRAAERMSHCRQPLEWNQEQQGKQHEFAQAGRHFAKSKGERVNQSRSRPPASAYVRGAPRHQNSSATMKTPTIMKANTTLAIMPIIMPIHVATPTLTERLWSR